MCISQFGNCTDGAKDLPTSRRRFIQRFLRCCHYNIVHGQMHAIEQKTEVTLGRVPILPTGELCRMHNIRRKSLALRQRFYKKFLYCLEESVL